MSINELEQHPYLDYYLKFKDCTTKEYYLGILIGSFPIYSITDTVNENEEVTAQRFTAGATMRFFYGSRMSNL